MNLEALNPFEILGAQLFKPLVDVRVGIGAQPHPQRGVRVRPADIRPVREVFFVPRRERYLIFHVLDRVGELLEIDLLNVDYDRTAIVLFERFDDLFDRDDLFAFVLFS